MAQDYWRYFELWSIELQGQKTKIPDLILLRTPKPNSHSRDLLHVVKSYDMASIDFLHRGNPQTLAGVEPATLDAEGHVDVRSALDTAYPGRGIERGGLVNWPARSPDLSCLDFFLWGHMKSIVYDSPVDSNDALVAKIAVVAGDIREIPGWYEKENGDCKTELAAGTMWNLKQEPALITDPISDVGKCI
ncbi:uncharacterized protein TNCV_1909701 [Trichonephila clavipes]|nr:uncharacterized protein TNCV_1909701 [Trichonephila clavipes]